MRVAMIRFKRGVSYPRLYDSLKTYNNLEKYFSERQTKHKAGIYKTTLTFVHLVQFELSNH